MAEQRFYAYEGMFLFPQSASSDLDGALAHVMDILGRAEAEIIAAKKWDDRRFAYEINKQKRGVYLLVYFRCESRKIAIIERQCNLSEQLLRQMILRADHLTEDEMRAADARESLRVESAMRADTGPAEKEAAPVGADADATGE